MCPNIVRKVVYNFVSPSMLKATTVKNVYQTASGERPEWYIVIQLIFISDMPNLQYKTQ